ncbi:septum site-determining protein MinC [Alkanindiges sp. WGS2144]|uniref:septum site-determining protein MinC n=1 Tax=Alkanindiges sp. WGS2144 TaxID=3366808 RepID=UPI003751EA3C
MSDLRINGRMVNFSRLIFQTSDLEKIKKQLEQHLGTQGEYDGALVILDSTVENNLISLIQLLVDFGLQPMAVIDGILGEQARIIQFPVLNRDQPMQRIKATADIPGANTEEAPTATRPVISRNTVHTEILRTGQSLSEDNGDIVLVADMNSGSELISSGNIHVYGTARGRIIAGASGQQQAHIFCQRLEAELVSIAGTYSVADDIPADKIGKSVHICLNSDQELEFHLLPH